MRNAKGQFLPGHHWRPRKPHWDKAWLRHQYIDLEKSAAEIAIACGCKENNIFYWLGKHDIPRRTMSEVRHIKHWGVSGSKNPMFGRKGKLNPHYIDGSSPERQRMYAQSKGKKFIHSVLSRDDYRCCRCGKRPKGHRSLHVHHITPWAGNKNLRFDFENAVTLCRPCHAWVHSKANIDKELVNG